MKKAMMYLIGGFSLLLNSCGSDAANDSALDAAWILFEQEQYDLAHLAFTAIATEENEANVGLGWTTFRMDSLTASERYFDLASTGQFIDGFSGAAFVKWHVGDFQACVDNAVSLLNDDSAYVFIHDSTITNQDIQLYEANGYYHLGNYAACILTIQELDPAFVASASDPNIEVVLLQKLETMQNLF